MIAQRTIVELIYEGVNITQDVAGDLLSFEWTDNESGKADDIAITLKNDHGKWNGDWFPQKGDVIKASIIAESGEGSRESIHCGRFEVDELTFAGPPSTVSIKGQSAPQGNDVRRTRRSKAWEDVTLEDVSKDIAERAGLTLIYDVSEFIGYDRIDQIREADVSFLMRLCREEGLSLKITDEQMVVFSEEDYESKAPVDLIQLGTSRVLSWSFDTQAYELARAASVRYYNAETGETIERTVEVPKPAIVGAPDWVNRMMGRRTASQSPIPGAPDWVNQFMGRPSK